MGGKGSQKLLPWRGSSPLRGDSRHPVQRRFITLSQGQLGVAFSRYAERLVRLLELAFPLLAAL